MSYAGIGEVTLYLYKLTNDLTNHVGVVGDTVDKRTWLPFGWYVPDCSGKAGISLESQADKSIFNNDWTTLVDNIQSKPSIY